MSTVVDPSLATPPAAKQERSKHAWMAQVKPFMQPDTRSSIFQIVNTIVPFGILWALMYYSLSVSYWLTLLLALPAGGMMVRAFIITHDCGHGSFFKSKLANSVVGYVTGVLSYTPFNQWRREHARHHATSGDLDPEVRGVGYIEVRTVDEYYALTPNQRMLYRFYRSPIILFLIGPLYIFLLEYRLPRRGGDRLDALSVLWTNIGLIVFNVALGLTVGFWNTFLIQAPLAFVATVTGVWLFYVQHHYEGAYWADHDVWSFEDAALKGSSYLKLPKVVQWFSGNINFHHIHHLCPKVPNYRLETCHNAIEMFRNVKPITLKDTWNAIGLNLWDRDTNRLVTYKEAEALRIERGLATPPSLPAVVVE
jgi:acyl-lipid omega-6 desaturase (Delta-12 desaturase)